MTRETGMMAHNDSSRSATVPRLAHIQRLVDLPSRWTLLLLGLWVFWRVREAGRPGLWLPLLAAYGLIVGLSTLFWLTRRADKKVAAYDVAVVYGTFILDALFVGALIWMVGGLGSPLYMLLVVLALKAAGTSAVLPHMVWMPFVFGPLYVLALYLATGNLAFLLDRTFLSHYILFWVWLTVVVLLAWQLNRRIAQTVSLGQALVQQQAALAQKTDVLQRTATDLGNRVLELRALQEVAKTLATALRVEETPRLVVETLHNITGSSHCAMGLLTQDEFSSDSETAILDGILLAPAAPGLEAFHLSVTEAPRARILVKAAWPGVSRKVIMPRGVSTW